MPLIMSPAEHSPPEIPMPRRPSSSPSSDTLSPRLIASRRRRYLELNPSYFASASADLELAEPLAYDRLIRRHQSAAEREREAQSKGWAGVLASSLVRAEAKLAAVDPRSSTAAAATSSHGDYHNIYRGERPLNPTEGGNGRGFEDGARHGPRGGSGGDGGSTFLQATDWSVAGDIDDSEDQDDNGPESDYDDDYNDDNDDTHDIYTTHSSEKGPLENLSTLDSRTKRKVNTRRTDGLLGHHHDGSSSSRRRHKEARRDQTRWRELVAARFVAGRDEAFEGYAAVDADEALDGHWREREREERWFDDEEPRHDDGAESDGSDSGSGGSASATPGAIAAAAATVAVVSNAGINRRHGENRGNDDQSRREERVVLRGQTGIQDF